MTTFKTVEARVWEADYIGPCRVVGLPGIGVVAYDKGGHIIYDLTDSNWAKEAVGWQRNGVTAAHAELSAAIIAAIEYAFPGCAATEGGAA